MVAPLSSFKWNTIYINCWKQKRAAEADERHVMQWKVQNQLLSWSNTETLFSFIALFFPPSNVLLCCFWLWGTVGEGSIKWLGETAARLQPQAGSADAWQEQICASLTAYFACCYSSPISTTPRLICAGERISFHRLMNIHEGRVFDAQAAEKMWRPMSEQCCSENSPPPISSTLPVDSGSVSFTLWNSFVFLWIIMLNRLYH